MPLVARLAVLLALTAVPAAAQESLRPVKLMVATARVLELERQFFGRVAAKESVDLAFQVGGQVIEFPVLEGRKIARGDLIARLDPVPFELSRDQAQLQRDQADRNFERMKKLQGSTVSEVALQDTETAAALAAIQLRNAEWALEQSQMQAPFDGLISSRYTSLFATVAAGAPVVRMHDVSEYHIQVDVPEILFQRAGRQDDLTITARFPSGPEEFPLEVLEFDAETADVGQTFRITFGMAPPEGLNILPGSSVTVSVLAHRDRKTIVVPPSALVISPAGETGVMQFEPAGAETGTVTWRPVTVEPTQLGTTQILSGLEDGAEIVAAGGGALEDGQAVHRFNGFSN